MASSYNKENKKVGLKLWLCCTVRTQTLVGLWQLLSQRLKLCGGSLSKETVITNSEVSLFIFSNSPISVPASTVSSTILPARQLSRWWWGDSAHQSSGKDLDDWIRGLSPCPSKRKELWSWWHGLLRTFCQKWGLKTWIHLSLRRQLGLWPGWRYKGCCDKDSTCQIQAQAEGRWWEVTVRVLQGHVQPRGEQTGSMPGCSRPRQDLHPSSELYVVRRHYALSLYVRSRRRLYRSLLVRHQWWNVLPPVDGSYCLVFHCSMYVLLLAASGLLPLWGHVQVLWWKTQSCWMTTDAFKVLCFSCSSRNTLVLEHWDHLFWCSHCAQQHPETASLDHFTCGHLGLILHWFAHQVF